MWLLFLEAGVALFLLVFIVWWTLPSGRERERKDRGDNASSEKDDAQH